MSDFIRAAKNWHRNLRNYVVGSYAESDLLCPGELPKRDDEAPFKLEAALKAKGVVPDDAYLVGYFYEIQRDAITLRFVHPSFSEPEFGQMIEEAVVPRFRQGG